MQNLHLLPNVREDKRIVIELSSIFKAFRDCGYLPYNVVLSCRASYFRIEKAFVCYRTDCANPPAKC